jgi:hypothetical protein
LLLLKKPIELVEIDIFRHLRVHNSHCNPFIFFLYLMHPHCASAKVRAASLVTDCTGDALSGSLMFEGAVGLGSGKGRMGL